MKSKKTKRETHTPLEDTAGAKYLKYVEWLGPNPNPPPLPFETWLAMERKWGRL